MLAGCGGVLAVVPVTINGHGPYSFAIDTGASQSLVDSAVAGELSVPKTGHTVGSDMLGQFDVVTIDYAHSKLVLHHRVRH